MSTSSYADRMEREGTKEMDTSVSVEIRLENLSFLNGKLKFVLNRYTTKNVPTRWAQRDHVRHPVEWKQSVRKATVFRFDRRINPERFCEVELPFLGMEKKSVLEIVSFLKIVPSWRQKEIDLEIISANIELTEREIQPRVDAREELRRLDAFYREKINKINSVSASLKTKPSSKASFVLRSVLTVPTLGLSWLRFVNKAKAQENQKTHEANTIEIKLIEVERLKKRGQKEKELIKINESIEKENFSKTQKIEQLKQKYDDTSSADYRFVPDESGFIDLRSALSKVTRFEKKGVYVIWNKTKDKYYVGQSKDVYKRLFTQHFNNNQVRNIIFVRDWDNGDEFYYQIHELETKDKLDDKEKELIETYGAFKKGYNSTSGNS